MSYLIQIFNEISSGLSNTMIVNNMKEAINCVGEIEEILPQNVINKFALLPIADAIKKQLPELQNSLL